jgi:hypothetical protein
VKLRSLRAEEPKRDTWHGDPLTVGVEIIVGNVAHETEIQMSTMSTPNNSTPTLSSEAGAVLRDWIRDTGMYALLHALGQRPTWFGRTHHITWDAGVHVSNCEFILDIVRKVEVLAIEVDYPMDNTHEDSPHVPAPNDPDGERPLTQREIVEQVKAEAMTALKEAELLKTERAAREQRKALRATKLTNDAS